LTLSAKSLVDRRSLRIFRKEANGEMALSDVQKGLIGQIEFIKLGTMGSKGRLDYASPYADDDRRDHEIHRRGRFGMELAVQTRISTRVYSDKPGRRLLNIRITVVRRRLVTSRMYWYFFALLDLQTMRFSDPCFLVPSTFLHRLKRPLGKTHWIIGVHASLRQDSRDRWAPYRVDNADIGNRLLEVLNDLQQKGVAPTVPARIRSVAGASIIRLRKATER
jgi:hypothetical protein